MQLRKPQAQNVSCNSHLQPLGGANTPIFSSTPASEYNASPWLESVCQRDNKCTSTKRTVPSLIENTINTTTTTFWQSISCDRFLQPLTDWHEAYIHSIHIILSGTVSHEKLNLSCHLRRTVLHHVWDGTCQLNEDAGADGWCSKTWTPSVPLGTDNHISIWNKKTKRRYSSLIFFFSTLTSWSQYLSLVKHLIVPASTKPLMTPKTLLIFFSVRMLLTSTVIVLFSSPSLLKPPQPAGAFWPPSCLWDADNNH